jgi:hypothetical protein
MHCACYQSDEHFLAFAIFCMWYTRLHEVRSDTKYQMLLQFLTKDTNKTSKLLVKVLRNAASVESNQQLQSCLFLHAQKCELLEGQREVFSDCEKQFSTQIEQAKVLLIAPLRVSSIF